MKVRFIVETFSLPAFKVKKGNTTFLGFRVWLAHWLLQGLASETTILRDEIRQARAELLDLRVEVFKTKREQSTAETGGVV